MENDYAFLKKVKEVRELQDGVERALEQSDFDSKVKFRLETTLNALRVKDRLNKL